MSDATNPPTEPAPARDQPLAEDLQRALIRDTAPSLMAELGALIDAQVPPATSNDDRALVALNILAHVIAPLLGRVSREHQAGFVRLIGGLLTKQTEPKRPLIVVPGGRG